MDGLSQTVRLKCLQCLQDCNNLLCATKCKHGLCERCLRSYVTEAEYYEESCESDLECPVCPDRVSRPQSDQVDQWIESLYSHNQLNLLMRTKDVEFLLLCEPCARRKSPTSAATVCISCEELLCENCSSVHKSSKSSRTHPLVGLQDQESLDQAIVNMGGIRVCNNHPGQPAVLVCLTHETLLCNSCEISDHTTCNVLKCGDDLASNTSVDELVERYKADLLRVKVYCEELLKHLAEDLETFAESVRAIRKDISVVREAFNSKLDQYEQEFLAKADYIKEMKVSEINESVMVRSSIFTAIDYDLDILEAMVQKGTAFQSGLYCLAMSERSSKYKEALSSKLPKITKARFVHGLSKDVFTIGKDNAPFRCVSCWPEQISVQDLLQTECDPFISQLLEEELSDLEADTDMYMDENTTRCVHQNNEYQHSTFVKQKSISPEESGMPGYATSESNLNPIENELVACGYEYQRLVSKGQVLSDSSERKRQRRSNKKKRLLTSYTRKESGDV